MDSVITRPAGPRPACGAGNSSPYKPADWLIGKSEAWSGVGGPMVANAEKGRPWPWRRQRPRLAWQDEPEALSGTMVIKYSINHYGYGWAVVLVFCLSSVPITRGFLLIFHIEVFSFP
jgi:hypothetical protein